MTLTDDEPTTRPADLPRPPAPDRFVFRDGTRVGVSVGIVAVVVVTIGLSALATDDRNGYVLAHSLAAVPFLGGALVCAAIALRRCPPQYRTFWRRWYVANQLAGLATLAALGAVVLHSPWLMAVDMVLLVAAVPFWTSAALHMLAAQAGRRDTSIDVVDSTMALVVLSAPGVLLLADPMLETSDLIFAGPFAFFLALVPAGAYSAFVNLARVPAGERVAQALGVALAALFSVSVALQLAHVVGELDLPLPVFVGFHAANLALVMALPLWAHRVTAGGLGRLPVERQVRRANPMPTISAVVLPLLTVYVFALRSDDGWTVGYLAGVLLAVVVLNALRNSMLSREAQRLSGDLASMAEERRHLLASMVRALDDDRRRTVSELHTQAVGSLSTLGTVVQTACVSLPPATATVVRDTVAQLQGDLSDRAEELRMLMVAMRPPSFAPAAVGEHALSAALRAYASEVRAEPTAAAQPGVQIVVDARLELDRSTMTIVCRLAQEALLNAVRHAGATLVAVTVGADERAGGVVVEVTDDGVGFDPAGVDEGSGLASMRLFTDLGRGEMTVRSTPGGGTVVRCVLGLRDDALRRPATATAGDRSTGGGTDGGDVHDGVAPAARPGRSHLRLVTSVEATGATVAPP
jgi:signal transduction histidine kinase